MLCCCVVCAFRASERMCSGENDGMIGGKRERVVGGE